MRSDNHLFWKLAKGKSNFRAFSEYEAQQLRYATCPHPPTNFPNYSVIRSPNRQQLWTCWQKCLLISGENGPVAQLKAVGIYMSEGNTQPNYIRLFSSWGKVITARLLKHTTVALRSGAVTKCISSVLLLASEDHNVLMCWGRWGVWK